MSFCIFTLQCRLLPSLSVGGCLCIYACVLLSMYVFMCGCAQAGPRGRRWMSSLIALLFIIELNPLIKHGAVRFAKASWSRTSEICLPPPPRTEITDVHYYAWLSRGCLGFEFISSSLCSKHFMGWVITSQAPSKTLFIFQTLKLIEYFSCLPSVSLASVNCCLVFCTLVWLYLDTSYK